ncbi:MAG TPA: hypothetical protein VLF60_04890 [Candidatus Saccharimonadales bacterium]|nr:hypothetical protein [Candidatus Saccharimonadales bacterium]
MSMTAAELHFGENSERPEQWPPAEAAADIAAGDVFAEQPDEADEQARILRAYEQDFISPSSVLEDPTELTDETRGSEVPESRGAVTVEIEALEEEPETRGTTPPSEEAGIRAVSATIEAFLDTPETAQAEPASDEAVEVTASKDPDDDEVATGYEKWGRYFEPRPEEPEEETPRAGGGSGKPPEWPPKPPTGGEGDENGKGNEEDEESEDGEGDEDTTQLTPEKARQDRQHIVNLGLAGRYTPGEVREKLADIDRRTMRPAASQPESEEVEVAGDQQQDESDVETTRPDLQPLTRDQANAARLDAIRKYGLVDPGSADPRLAQRFAEIYEAEKAGETGRDQGPSQETEGSAATATESSESDETKGFPGQVFPAMEAVRDMESAIRAFKAREVDAATVEAFARRLNESTLGIGVKGEFTGREAAEMMLGIISRYRKLYLDRATAVQALTAIADSVKLDPEVREQQIRRQRGEKGEGES